MTSGTEQLTRPGGGQQQSTSAQQMAGADLVAMFGLDTARPLRVEYGENHHAQLQPGWSFAVQSQGTDYPVIALIGVSTETTRLDDSGRPKDSTQASGKPASPQQANHRRVIPWHRINSAVQSTQS